MVNASQPGSGGAEVMAAAAVALAATSAAIRSDQAWYNSNLRVRMFDTAGKQGVNAGGDTCSVCKAIQDCALVLTKPCITIA